MKARHVSILLVVGMVALACADARGAPMIFTAGTWLKDLPAIYADGEIVADTPRRLEQFLAENRVKANTLMVFNSGGGNLVAGMTMGEIIRAHRLWTAVGSQKPIPTLPRKPYGTISGFYPGYCLSACTLSYLGGVRRDFDFMSIYGVHQASFACEQSSRTSSCPTWQQALSAAQVVSATVVAYVQKMGVDPAYIVEMAQAEPDTINPLSYDKMRQYRIVYVQREEKWDYQTTTSGDFYLQYIKTTEWKVQQAQFYCTRDNVPHLVMEVVYDTRTKDGREDAQRIVGLSAAGLKFFWTPTDANSRPLGEQVGEIVLVAGEIAQPPRLSNQGNVMFLLKISPRLLSILLSARSAQVTTVTKDMAGLGFNLIDFDVDHKRLSDFSRNCR